MTTFSDAAWADMHEAMWAARVEARLLVSEMFGQDLRITSGRRKPTSGGSSLHGSGKAMDIGVKNPDGSFWSHAQQRAFAKELQARLGEDFEVIVEGPAATNPKYKDRVAHVHVEYQPKGRHAEAYTE